MLINFLNVYSDFEHGTPNGTSAIQVTVYYYYYIMVSVAMVPVAMVWICVDNATYGSHSNYI